MSYLSDSWLGEVQQAVSNDACVVPAERRRCAAGCGTILRQSNKGRVCSLCDELGRESLTALRGERTAALRARSYRAQRRALPAAVELAEADDVTKSESKGRSNVTREEYNRRLRERYRNRNGRRKALPGELCERGCGNPMHHGCCKGTNHGGGFEPVRIGVRSSTRVDEPLESEVRYA